MVYDHLQYEDPCKIAIKEERDESCKICKANIEEQYRCLFGVNGYPEHTKDTCKTWRSKKA